MRKYDGFDARIPPGFDIDSAVADEKGLAGPGILALHQMNEHPGVGLFGKVGIAGNDAHQNVKVLGRQLDPYSLISEGAPKDEFDQEVAKILANLPKCSSGDDLNKLMLDVFFDQFNERLPHDFFSPILDKVFALKSDLV